MVTDTISRGVPLWRHPFPDESARGLMLHLAERNRYPSAEFVAKCLGLNLIKLGRGDASELERLARAIHCDQSRLIPRASLNLPDKTKWGNGPIVIKGEIIGARMLRLHTNRRVCPDCLIESRHHRFWWDLQPVTTCPRHQRSLVDRCSCGQNATLTWADEGVFCCRRCGSEDPRNLLSMIADASVIRADAYLLGRLGVADRVCVPELDGANFTTTVDIMTRVGAADVGGYLERWQSSKTLGVPDDLMRARGFSILADNKFSDLLDRLYEGYRHSKSKYQPSLGAAYGWLYRWMNLTGKPCKALREMMIEHAADIFLVDKRARTGKWRHSKLRTVSLREAIETYGLPRGRALQLAIGLGMAEVSSGKGRWRPFTKEDIERLRELLPNAGTARQAMTVLNVEMRAWLHLARAGLVKPLTDKRVTKRRHMYDLREVAKFTDRLAGAAPFVKKTREGLVPIIRSYIGTDKVCQMILDKKIRVLERLSGENGLRSLFVDPTEVHRLCATTDEVSLFMASRTIHASTETTREYFNGGLLTGRIEKQRILISATSLQEFRRRYITIRELTRRTGLTFSHDCRWIAMAGVKPVKGRGGFRDPIYPRDPVEKKLPKIIAAAQAEAGTPSRVKWVGKEALDILLKAEKPMNGMDLFRLIGNKRMKLPSDNPITVFRKILWLNRDKIECIRKAGYWPKGRPLDRRNLAGSWTTWRRIGLLVREHLAKCDRPVANPQLVSMLSMNGIKIQPTYPAQYLSRALRRHREHIVYLRWHGYWLRNKPYKPANYRPDKDMAAAA